MRTHITVGLDGRKVERPYTTEENAAADAMQAAETAAQTAPLTVIERTEKNNPITHRALRELILSIGEAFPGGKQTVLYQRVLATELAIRAERAKL